MKNKRTLILLLAAFALFVGGAALLYSRLTPGTSAGLAVEPGAAAPAPDAEAPDAGGSDASPDAGSDAAEETKENEENGDDAEEERIAAPDFTAYDGADAAVQLSGFAGKPVILNFWASWCGPCKSEMPDFETAYGEHGEDIHFVMVNATYGRETRQDADAYLAENGYTFPVYYDTDYSAAAAYGVTAFPTTFFIDAEGYLVAYASGALDAETLQRGIEMILPAA